MRVPAQSKILALIVILLSAVSSTAKQDDSTVDQAVQVLLFLQQEQFDQVAARFNAQLASELSANQLAEMWTDLRDRIGEFQMLRNQRLLSVVTGGDRFPAVLLTCRFELGAMNVLVEFDLENKIAGLSFEPPAWDPILVTPQR